MGDGEGNTLPRFLNRYCVANSQCQRLYGTRTVNETNTGRRIANSNGRQIIVPNRFARFETTTLGITRPRKMSGYGTGVRVQKTSPYTRYANNAIYKRRNTKGPCLLKPRVVCRLNVRQRQKKQQSKNNSVRFTSSVLHIHAVANNTIDPAPSVGQTPFFSGNRVET